MQTGLEVGSGGLDEVEAVKPPAAMPRAFRLPGIRRTDTMVAGDPPDETRPSFGEEAKEVMPMARFLRDMLVGVLAGIIAQILYRIFTGK